MRILCADNGSEVTIWRPDAHRCGWPLVWSLDGRKRLVTQPMASVLPNGRNEVFTVRLASDRETESAANSSFLTPDTTTT
jgi:hypothetical protein